MRRVLCWLIAGLLVAGPGPADEPKADKTAAPAAEAVGKPVLVLDAGGHTAAVRKVLFTPDGKHVISVSLDKTIRLWDVATGQTRRVLRPPAAGGHIGELLAADLSPDGRTLAVAGWGFIEKGKHVVGIHLITLATEAMRTLRGHTGAVTALSFSRDGKRLASASRDMTARVWDVDSGVCVQTFEGHTGAVFDVAFAPGHRRLVTASGDGTGRIWQVESGKLIAELKGGTGAVFAAAWSADGKTVVTGGADPAGLRVWEPNGKARKVVPLDKPEMVVADLVFKRPAGAGAGSEVLASWRLFHDKESRCDFGTTFINLATGTLRPGMQTQHGTAATPMSTTLSPQLGATCGGDNHAIWLWTTSDGTVIQRLASKGRPPISAAWSRDGTRVAWGVRRYPGDTAPPLQMAFRFADQEMLRKPNPEEFRGAWTTLGRLSAAKTSDTVLAVKESDRVLATITKQRHIDAWTFLPGDRIAISAALQVVVHNARNGNVVHRYEAQEGLVWALAPSPDGKYLLSAAADETLRITPVAAIHPMLTLFVVGNEWVAWTPRSYYAASAGGEKLIGWQTGGSPDALASFHPASAFHQTLHRPDVIGKVLQAGNVKKALAALDKERSEKEHKAVPSQEVEVDEVLPPEVQLTAPAVQDGKIDKPELKVEAVAEGKGKHPVLSMQLLLDGRPYTGGQGRYKIAQAKPGKVSHTSAVVLPEGEHTLRVVARSDVSTGFSNELDVNFATTAPKSKLFVLVVGIDHYADKNLDLHCAANDATELAETFVKKSEAVFAVQPPKVLIDSVATRDGILGGLNWLREGMKPEDVAVIFYAGHGEKDDRGHFYLLPQDVNLTKLADTGISGEKFKEKLADLPGRVVLLLDACHSGAIGKVINDMARDLASEDCGVVVVCAALGSEKAGEQGRHGYFCQALLEVLQGDNQSSNNPPPKNPLDGRVYLHHVEQYVIDRVQYLSKDEQHPTAAKPALRPLPLAKP
jgi:WD40 repeat protein